MSTNHLLGIDGMAATEITAILDQAQALKTDVAMGRTPREALRGKTVLNLFFENSTRTRTSFELAAKRLGADVVNWSVSTSSAAKGETLLDTVKNLDAMHAAAMVIRHSSSGAPHFVARHVDCAVVNAGDGMHEHPTQALLDAFTLREQWGDLKGRTVAIVGDILHSRVARSDLHCLSALGCKLRVCGPPTMIPKGVELFGCTVVHTLQEALEGADAAMVLRIQLERMQDARFPSAREYSRIWGLNARSMAWLPPHAVILHPGPINRGLELASDLADSPRSVIFNQVENGVFVRMAALLRACGHAYPVALPLFG
jgi:aspartate carbamoyltransferase catalytic subunit